MRESADEGRRGTGTERERAALIRAVQAVSDETDTADADARVFVGVAAQGEAHGSEFARVQRPTAPFSLAKQVQEQLEGTARNVGRLGVASDSSHCCERCASVKHGLAAQACEPREGHADC